MADHAHGHHVLLKFDRTLCRYCSVCLVLRSCKGNLIRSSAPGEPFTMEAHSCRECLRCMGACPRGAIMRFEIDDDTAPLP